MHAQHGKVKVLSDRYLAAQTAKVESKYSKQIGKLLSNIWQYFQNCKGCLREGRSAISERYIEADLKKQIDDVPKRTIDELLGAVNSNSFFLARNFGVESYIPKYAQLKRRRSFILTKIAL